MANHEPLLVINYPNHSSLVIVTKFRWSNEIKTNIILAAASSVASAFEHAQNAQIRIILRMHKVSSGSLLSIYMLCSGQLRP